MKFEKLKSELRSGTEVLCLLAILAGISLRFVGLGHRQHSSDEMHYRDDMTNAQHFYETGKLRDHSVRHRSWYAPHGMLGPFLSLRVGWPINTHLRSFLPDDNAYRENLLARLSYALESGTTVAVMFLLALNFFGRQTALFLTALTALSPLLINWGRSEYLDTPMTLFALLSFLMLAWLLRAQKYWHQMGLALASGFFSGLMLASKWTGILIFPFVFFILCFSRNLQVSRPRRALLLSLLCISFASCSLAWLSVDSFVWALFPKSVDPDLVYGDTHRSFLQLMWEGTIRIGTLDSLKAVVLLWGGPILPVLVLLTALVARKGQLKRDTRVFFIFTLLVCAVFIGIFQESYYAYWRATFLVPLFILSTGFVVEKLKPLQLKLAIAMLFLLTLPLGIREGLRLRKPLVDYYGAEFLYSSPVPEFASGIFP